MTQDNNKKFSSPHSRLLMKGLILLLLSTLLLAFEHIIPDPRPASLPRTPNTIASADAYLFYFQAIPTWSKVTIDGQVLTQLPTQNSNTPIPLSPGQHSLTWESQPFQPYHCTISIPSTTSSENCPQKSISTKASSQNPTFLLQLPISLTRLPQTEQTALLNTIQATLDSRRTTEPLTNQPSLSVTQRFVLHTTTTPTPQCHGLTLGQGCAINTQNCIYLCNFNEWPIITDKQPQWHIAAIFHRELTYQTQDGQPTTPPISTSNQHEDNLVTLNISWHQNAWHVTFHTLNESSFDDPACINLINAIYINPSIKQNKKLSWSFTSDPHQAGCLAIGYTNSSPNLSLSYPDNIALLERFNTITAANPQAQQLWPALPHTSSSELQLVQKMQSRATK